MKITIVTGPWLPVPPIQGGAVERSWYGLAQEFASKNHQVTVICRSYPGHAKEELLDGIQYLRRSGFSQSQNIILDLIKDFIYALNIASYLPQADILVINDFWLPVIATLFPNAGKIVIHVGRVPKKQHFLYFKSSLLVAASRAIFQKLLEQNPNTNQSLCIIPYPIDIKVFNPFPKKAGTEDRVILYIGRIHPEKGLNLLIHAFRLMHQSSSYKSILRIIGPYQKQQGGAGRQYLEVLQEQSQDLTIEFLEPIFYVQKLAEAYRQADLFCYPSLAEQGESFGVAPLEAMACGLVPVVSSLECFRDFIEEDVTGYFFDHRSSNAAQNLADILSLAITNWDKTCAMREQAIQTAQAFKYASIAERYLEEFTNLIKEG